MAKFWDDYRLRMLLEGITPLLQHNPGGMKAAPTGTTRKTIPLPEDEAEAATYRRPDNTLGHPANAVRACLLGGATGLKIGRKAASTVLAETIGFFPPMEGDELFPLEDDDGKPITTFAIDTRRAVVQSSGVLRSRPKIMPWRLRCNLKLTMPGDTDIQHFRMDLIDLVNQAGKYPGIGDGRPEKKKGKGLWFGKFNVVELEIEPLED
jgi:hypothetical protein